MNSMRGDIEINPFADRGSQKQSAKPVPIDQRPLDNEYAWKGNPYQLDGWLLPAVTAMEFSCDDPQVAWFTDAPGRIHLTRDGMKTWQDVSWGLMGARARNIKVSDQRTYVIWADTDRGAMMSRDGGMSWRTVADGDEPRFPTRNFSDWQSSYRIDEKGALLYRNGNGNTARDVRMAHSSRDFRVRPPRRVIAGEPGGVYRSDDGEKWTQLVFWPRNETGAADFLHAYWWDVIITSPDG